MGLAWLSNSKSIERELISSEFWIKWLSLKQDECSGTNCDFPKAQTEYSAPSDLENIVLSN